ncbi:MAG: uroporphyrinogen-III decarboxylase-like protein [Lentisphaerae bacterium]|nr:uroporphyrinogen-III decarboxylase-like protein [Lentisphaerota bacterium]
MHKETMNPRERWEAVLKREKPDRIPMDYWATKEASAKLVKHMQCGDLDEALAKLHVDRPRDVYPRYIGPPRKEDTDSFGCKRKRVQYGDGYYYECASNPLAQYNSVEEIEKNYTWPTNDDWDFSGIADSIKGYEDQPIKGGGSEPFLIYCHLRGMEQAYMDLALNPEIVHYCLDKLFDLAYDWTLRIYEQIPGKVLISYVAEDLGSQESLLFSLDHIREFILPRMKRMMTLAHDAGVYVFTHSDGAIRDVIPDFIKIGSNVLNPIQWRCLGMEREGLKKDFGDKLIFHGAVDNQEILPFGSVEDVREEVLENMRVLGAGGGYILAPCHNIQVVSPAENIIAMYETCYENGWS